MLTASADAAAGQRPDFSGTWVATPDAAPPATGRPALPNYGPQVSITHAEPALTMTRTFAGAPATIRYVLDGSEVASSWYHEYDGGRAFQTALGHLPSTYSDADFLHHVYGGIYWAATGKGFKAQ
jgi:type 1 glutamine amidotransferase